MSFAAQLETVGALMRRGLNEILRVPGAAIPGILAPTIFFLGLTAVFGNLTLLPGFTTESYQSFLIPISLMQAAGFTGAATGVNLARDIEQGWFDRLLASPASRFSLLAGLVLSASFRVLIPATFLLIVAFALGAHFPGLDGLAIAVLIVMGMAVVASAWGVSLALRFKTQSAAPLMQAGMLTLILTTTAYAPLDLLTGWLQEVARYNP
ncbi:MAG TPA: ABC transporter permease, partial [Solirubrobacterales bacterium]|nr:ABC transporter permease [Solirubrobacterales bacterium]